MALFRVVRVLTEYGKNALMPGIYRGWVRHRRSKPTSHEFRYPLAMVMFDLDFMDDTFAKSKLWSRETFNCISFRRKDYIQSDNGIEQSIKSAVKGVIQHQTGQDFDGRILLLTHPRYLGFVMNPVSFYFCYVGDDLAHIVAEINNTPWDERFTYVLSVDNKVDSDSTQVLSFDFDKNFHVSPFMPMDMQYRWRFSLQHNKINIHMLLMQQGEKVFDATMQGSHQPFTAKSMGSLPFAYPLQTVLVAWRIYWHALLLYVKGIRFHTHPKNVKNN